MERQQPGGSLMEVCRREESRNLRPISSMMVVISVVEGIRDALPGVLSSSAEWSRCCWHGAACVGSYNP